MSFPKQFSTATLKVVAATTDPAANTECSQTVPAATYWELLAVSVSCAQGATQTPWPSLVLDDGTNTIFQGFSGTAAMSAATTTQHTWAPNLGAVGSAATTANTGPLPAGIVLGPGCRVGTSTTGKGANTNYAAPTIYVIEYT